MLVATRLAAGFRDEVIISLTHGFACRGAHNALLISSTESVRSRRYLDASLLKE